MAKRAVRVQAASVRLNGPRFRHGGGVKAVRWSPRGDLLASVAFDGRLALWDVHGALVRSLGVADPFVTALCFSPAGDRVVAGKKALRVWDVATGAVRLTLRHRDTVNRVDWSPDGALLATACDDHCLRLFDATTGDERARWRFEDQVMFVRFSPDGRHLLTASEGMALLLTVDGARVASADCAGWRDMLDAAFTPDGREVLVAPHDGRTLHRLRVPSLEPIATVELDHGLRCVDVSPDGRHVAFGGFGRYAPTPHPEQVGQRSVHSTYVSLWRLDPWGPVARLRGHTELVEGVSFSPDGALLASCSGDSSVRVWRVDDGAAVGVPDAGFEDDPHGGAWLDDDTAAACAYSETLVWRAGGAFVAQAWDARHQQVERCAGGFVAMGVREVSRWRFDGAALDALWTTDAVAAQLTALACTADGARVFAADGEGRVMAWFDGERAPRWTVTLAPAGAVLSLACAPDGSWLAAMAGHETAWFRVRSGDGEFERVELPAPEGGGASDHQRYVCAVEVTPDGARVVLSLVGGDVEVCDAVTGERVLRIASRATKRAGSYGGFGARCAAVSPDGRAVAVSARYADDTRVRVFSLDDGALRGESKEADGVIDHVRWSPDGARLLTVGFRAREVRVWNVEALRR